MYNSGDEGLLYGLSAGIAILFFLVAIGITIAIILILQNAFKRVPAEHRKQEPGMVWLLLIPCFSIVWNFFVFPKLSQSLKSYFDAKGQTDVGDCAESLGLTYSILVACSIIPYLGMLTGIASLVVLIIYLIKVNELKNMIPPEEAGGM